MSFALSTIALVGLGISAAGGAAKAVDGGIKANKAKKAAIKAKAELDKQRNAFRSLDTSNPYLNMENTMEDLTVNKQQSEFQKQQSMQSQSNIMQSMRGAAGGSGIASLAQALANQGSLDAQKSSINIGKQEQANQRAERSQAGKIQGLEIGGEIMSRQAEMGKVESLMGMSADDLANSKAEQAAAKSQMFEGIADVGSAVVSSGMGGGGKKVAGGVDAGSMSGVDFNTSLGNPYDISANPFEWRQWNSENQ